MTAAQLVILLARGPHVGRKTWLGWHGGLGYRKRNKEAEEETREPDVEKGAMETPEKDGEIEAGEKAATGKP